MKKAAKKKGGVCARDWGEARYATAKATTPKKRGDVTTISPLGLESVLLACYRCRWADRDTTELMKIETGDGRASAWAAYNMRCEASGCSISMPDSPTGQSEVSILENPPGHNDNSSSNNKLKGKKKYHFAHYSGVRSRPGFWHFINKGRLLEIEEGS